MFWPAEIPVVLASGYGSMPFERELAPNEAPEAVLPKPYAPERLLATLMRVMRPRV